MFDQLAGRLERMMKFLRGEGTITEKNMAEALKMIRLALLEADVNYKVVKEFEAKIKEKCLGEDVLSSLTPAQMVIKIVRDELADILGGRKTALRFAGTPPSVFMLVGLQGSGKTTTCAKLARWVSGTGRRPFLVSFDLKRLAAQAQLKTLAAGLGLPFAEMTVEEMASPAKALAGLLRTTKSRGFDPLIVDTAGRLHVDEELMNELRLAKDVLDPSEVIYVGDAMTGQDAVRSARVFDEKIGLTSIILTKLDGDARGGAALSVVSVTGKPIVFIGLGEKTDKLEVFHPDRMASRILGMGDVLSLIERAEETADIEEAEELAKKIRKQTFTLDDFKRQLVQMKKMGPLSQVLGHLPQAGPLKHLSRVEIDDHKILHYEAIINSMTPAERENPKLLNGSRRQRIARGSGRPVHEVNQLVKQFQDMQKMMKKPQFLDMFSRMK
jgi:signal recognition particle subunit SRP54